MEISTLSNILSKVLDILGANKWTRKKHYECAMLGCILSYFNNIMEDDIVNKHAQIEVFGSMVEGTTTYEMGSDSDIIQIMLKDVVEKDSGDKDVTNKGTLVVVADMFTPPGYVKIKAIERDFFTFAFSHETVRGGTFFVSNEFTDYCESIAKIKHHEFKAVKSFERHGPALTCEYLPSEVSMTSDLILGLRCESVFSFNKGFFHRTRQNGWPSQATLDILKGQGCLLVPLGHIHCDKKYRSLQWRISFSFQERHLVLNLNSAQFKCYILLKLIKKSYISPIVDLTSYHCKTALFYTIENTPCEIWSEDNLLNCYILCLKRLKRWAKRHFCPNYFIQELNLFTGKIQEQDMYKLTVTLSNLIEYPLDFLMLISGSFRDIFQLYTTNYENSERELQKFVNGCQFAFQSKVVLSLLSIRNTILHKISYNCNDINEIIIRHYKWLNTINTFQESNSIGHYPLDGIQWALPHVCRFLHSSLASHLAIKATETANTVMKSWFSVTAAYHYWMGLDSDAMSGKLKLAAILLYTGYLNMKEFQSRYQLTSATELQLSQCGCRIKEHSASTDTGKSCFQDLLKSKQMCQSFRLELSHLSASQYIEKYLSACTIFLPSERKIVPYPLQFEMSGSFGRLKNTHLELNNCACLDSKVYSILLSIYTSGKQEKERHMMQLDECLSSDNYQHRDTTLNIMGWLASAEKINPVSLRLYKQSWEHTVELEKHFRPMNKSKDRNAAKWHLVLLLYRAWLIKKRNSQPKT